MRCFNKKIDLLVIIFFLILPRFSFGQDLFGKDLLIGYLPKNIDEAKEMGVKILSLIPEILKFLWNDFLNICQKIYYWIFNIWKSYIQPFLNNIWQEIIKKEIKKRKKIIEEEFQKETNELKQEIQIKLPTKKSLWEKFKSLFKK